MKFFAFFMAVLFLVLSVMPCADGASAMKVGKTTVLKMKADHGDSKTGDDNCSPFCQCACCAGFSINHPIASIQFVPTHFIAQFFSYSLNNSTGIAPPIWQPPKLYS